MQHARLTKWILEFYETKGKVEVEQIKWTAAVREDLKVAGIVSAYMSIFA